MIIVADEKSIDYGCWSHPQDIDEDTYQNVRQRMRQPTYVVNKYVLSERERQREKRQQQRQRRQQRRRTATTAASNMPTN
jgi:hypothetical protein